MERQKPRTGRRVRGDAHWGQGKEAEGMGSGDGWQKGQSMVLGWKGTEGPQECPGTRLRGSGPSSSTSEGAGWGQPLPILRDSLCPCTKEKLFQSGGQGERLMKWGRQESRRWLEAWVEDGVGRGSQEGGEGLLVELARLPPWVASEGARKSAGPGSTSALSVLGME